MATLSHTCRTTWLGASTIWKYFLQSNCVFARLRVPPLLNESYFLVYYFFEYFNETRFSFRQKKDVSMFSGYWFFLFHIPLVCPVPWFSGFRNLPGFVMVRLYAMVVFSCSSEYFFLALFWHFQSGSEQQLVTLLASFNSHMVCGNVFVLDWLVDLLT